MFENSGIYVLWNKMVSKNVLQKAGWAMLRPFLYTCIFLNREVYVADAHAHIQRLVSVVKMVTVLEEYTAEEWRSAVRFYGQKDSMQRILINKCFLFTMRSACRVKRFSSGSTNVETFF
jgi:hypothetical protein